MKWTTKAPAKPGFYWFKAVWNSRRLREDAGDAYDPKVVEVDKSDFKKSMSGKRGGHYFGMHGKSVTRLWAGPLEVPEKWVHPDDEEKNL